ncbi:hypothetical protein [Methylomonas methanica]|uniref:hypothetical protein n=1 Tax=Methylomonas methanica TaxID=421 RepID=UPI000B1B59AF|nr:hypothetical protein [Methylomonas methanica]
MSQLHLSKLAAGIALKKPNPLLLSMSENCSSKTRQSINTYGDFSHPSIMEAL